MMTHRSCSQIAAGAGLAAALMFTSSTLAQIDPAPRQLLHLGVNQSMLDDGPMGAYAFYYWNIVGVPSEKQNLRLAIAPGYVDSELGFNKLLGENTDLGLGVFGGLFANSYQEMHSGNYFRDESFDGHGGGVNLSIYHRFNPDSRIPLSGMLRGGVNYHTFDKTDDTGDTFRLPDDQPFYSIRTGLRWGGKEPMLGPALAMELSVWYQLQYRPDDGTYGYGNDRELEDMSHRFLGRALINFTTPESHHYISAGLLGGSVVDADRFSAGRVGGVLPFTSEFPLFMPGYFDKELSVENFGMIHALYSIPFGSSRQWNIMAMGATGYMDMVDDIPQEGEWHSGLGAGLGYSAPSKRWRIFSMFGYGVDAQRTEGQGGYSIAIAFQYNFGDTVTDSDRAFQEMEAAFANPTR